MSESFKPQFQPPELHIEPPYADELPDKIEKQYDESFGEKGKNWRFIAAMGGAAAAIIVSAAGLEYFRRTHGDEE